jgi:hypothetical protein
MPECVRCSIDKPATEFHKGHRKCKACRWELQKIQRSQPEVKRRRAEYKRKSRLKSRYGITVEQYDTMWLLQRGLCAICKQSPDGKYPLVVDHDHDTGQARKLLCNRCNVLIGMAREDVDILESAIRYLTYMKERGFSPPQLRR